MRMNQCVCMRWCVCDSCSCVWIYMSGVAEEPMEQIQDFYRKQFCSYDTKVETFVGGMSSERNPTVQTERGRQRGGSGKERSEWSGLTAARWAWLMRQSRCAPLQTAEQVCIVMDGAAGVHHGMSAEAGGARKHMKFGRRTRTTQTNRSVSRAGCDKAPHPTGIQSSRRTIKSSN